VKIAQANPNNEVADGKFLIFCFIVVLNLLAAVNIQTYLALYQIKFKPNFKPCNQFLYFLVYRYHFEIIIN
jgi:hypothetical protein